jgi:hypothetical protein
MIAEVNWVLVGKTTQAVWNAVGPLIGVLIGGWMTYRIQSRQWLANTRKEEYRELLTALTDAASSLIENAQMKLHMVQSGETQRLELQQRTKEKYFNSLKIMQDRLFIAREVEQMELFDRWGRAMKDLQETNKYQTFEDRFEAIQRDIVNRATKT